MLLLAVPSKTALFPLVLVCASAGAETRLSDSGIDWSKVDARASVSVFLENDVLLLNNENEDRNYTMGFAMQGSGRWIDRLYLNRPRLWVDSLFGIDDLHERDRSDESESRELVQLGVSAFTPDDLRESSPQQDDRPYSSILYLISKHQSVTSDHKVAVTSELSLGILGLSIAEWFQTWLHEKLQSFPGDTPYTPKGWSLQISDSGEPTARYALRWQQLVDCGKYYDLQWNAEGHVGYYTNAALGGAVRVGAISSPWWAFSSAPISENAVMIATASVAPDAFRAADPCSQRESEGFELYAWGAANARFWVYNALLQGQFHESAVTISSGDVERLVGEYQAGVTTAFPLGNSWHSLSYAYARRTAEFEGPRSRAHSWAGIYYSFTRGFE